MMKEVIRSMEHGDLAVIGLIAFFVAFVLILARVVLMKKSERDEAKRIPLEDDTVFKSDTDHANE